MQEAGEAREVFVIIRLDESAFDRLIADVLVRKRGSVGSIPESVKLTNLPQNTIDSPPTKIAQYAFAQVLAMYSGKLVRPKRCLK